MKRNIIIYDTTLRDGEQAPGFSMNPAGKVAMAEELIMLGVDVIEAGFPASSQSEFEAVRLISELSGNFMVAALARSQEKDIDIACNSLRHAGNPLLHLFIPASDILINCQMKSNREMIIEHAVKAVKRGVAEGVPVQFSLMDAFRGDISFLCHLISAVIDAGAERINLSDTVGYAFPGDIMNMVRGIKGGVKGIDAIILSIHCHNDLGMAVANTLAALEGGADQAECTVNGIGERAGNASLEELVTAITVRNDHYSMETGIDTTRLVRASRALSSITGIGVQANKPVVGENVISGQEGSFDFNGPDKRGYGNPRWFL